MAKIMKKAQDGYMAKIKKSAVSDTSRKMGMNFDKKSFDSLPKMKKKAKNGFGMLSVKAGVDSNPKATFADKIAGAKKKAKSGKKMQHGGKAMYGKSMMKSGGKCKNGC